MEWHEHPPDPASDIPDDDEVIARVRENSDYFSVLYERYFQRVYGYCLKRTSNVQIAEDLCSDIFIKVLSKLDTYTGGNFAAWLFRIAHNTVVDHYRKNRKVVAIDQLQLRSDTQMSNTVANQLAVEELLSELNEDERELITLRLQAGLSAPEIAEIVGKSANSVRVQIYRLLKRLRDRYGAMMGGDA